METGIGSNWIPDRNRFSLPKPPAWFLKALWDQDAALVILPSRVSRKYLLARRREHGLRAPLMAKAHNELLRQTRGSDGDMLASHNVLHVDAITGNVYGGTWTPAIIQELKDRDTWALGGGDKLADKLDAADRAAEVEKRTKWEDNIEQRAKDSWRSYQARTGQRNHHARNSGVRVKQSSSSTAGLGS